MPAFDLKLQGSDVGTAFGLYVIDLVKHFGGPDVEYAEVLVAGKEGATETTIKPVVKPRDYIARCVMTAASESAYNTQLDALNLALYRRTVAIIGGNQDARQLTGKVTSVTEHPIGPGIDIWDEGNVDIAIHCFDPLWYATSASSVTGAASTDLAIPLGTWSSKPIVTVNNPSSPLVLTYKNYGGSTVETMTLTFGGSPASAVIDMSAETITIGGTRDDDALTAGDFFEADPLDGDYALSHFPTIRASSGSGSPAVSIAYTKRFA